MARYLMRGGLNPLEVKPIDEIIYNNLIGANTGNLLYAFGVYRTLMTEDTVIDMDYYGVEKSYNDADIKHINETYDAYICPLADAFRDEFVSKLYKYADFFDKLTIPFYVIGLGMRSSNDDELEKSYSFDNAAKAFITAATRKGGVVGLRGAKTGRYLTRLGFKEGKHFMVIGCPSMYICGRHLKVRELPRREDGTLPDDIKLALNMSSITPESVMEFQWSLMERFKDHYIVEQNEAELRMLYYGVNYSTNKVGKDSLLPRNALHPILQSGRYKVFPTVPSWREFMEGMDLSIGSKLHGNVAALISGCPAIFFPLDGRMRELIEYHKLPAIRYEEIREDDTLESLMARVDMYGYLEKAPENFDRFIDFLDLNGIDHIYKQNRERIEAPVDLKMAQLQYPVVEPFLFCSRQEAVRRVNAFAAYAKKKATPKASKKSSKASKVVAKLRKGIAKPLRGLVGFAEKKYWSWFKK